MRLVVLLAMLTASFGVVQAAPQPQACALPCFENFDDGVVEHATLSGLWHVSGACSDPVGSRIYLGYNLDETCNYETGARTAGEFVLAVDLRGTTTASLRFSDVVGTEGHPDYDRETLSVSTDGSQWTTLVGPTYDRTFEWLPVTIDLSEYAGERRVLLRWAFDSQDHLFNYPLGWLIDDISVTAEPVCAGNDARANACALSERRQQMTHGATLEAQEVATCGVGGATLWYRYTHTGEPRVLMVDTFGSTFDSVVAVYDGAAPAACNDDAYFVHFGGPKEFPQARAHFLAAPGRTYDIAVGGWMGETGSLLIHVGRALPKIKGRA